VEVRDCGVRVYDFGFLRIWKVELSGFPAAASFFSPESTPPILLQRFPRLENQFFLIEKALRVALIPFARRNREGVIGTSKALLEARAGPSRPEPMAERCGIARRIDQGGFMPLAVEPGMVGQLQDEAHLLTGAAEDYDPLLEAIGDAHCVMLGEASHGTHEFYKERAEITKRLIREKGFNAVAVEADWPDAYRINHYVRGRARDSTAMEALGDFQRFPAWMWRNSVVLDFVGWLRAHNDPLAPESKTGFYGLDLYSLYSSINEVIRYLEKVDPNEANRARERYACFDHFGADPQAYGFLSGRGNAITCEEEVIRQLGELQRRALEYARRDGRIAEDEFFQAEQNARVAKNAEEYYRAMYRGRVSTWNLRDQHMAETVDELFRHLRKQGRDPKVVLWAHNSHLGDARATQMADIGELNVGQLMKEKFGHEVYGIGFTTYSGTVSAAANWGAPVERKRLRRALPGSYEALFHELEIPRFLLEFRSRGDAAELLRETRIERAIGVIYRPDTERQSHYFFARLSRQFDAVLHFDETRAVEPLERAADWEEGEIPETYPFGV
jgi:erythromycin esterase-like protein